MTTPERHRRVDVHQHLWTEPLIAELERRGMWKDGTLKLPGEPDSTVVPDDLEARAQLVRDDGLDVAIVAPSFALGPELLPAYQEGVRDLPPEFRAYSAFADDTRGFVGLAIAATDVPPPGLDVPLFVHPGQATGTPHAALTDYVTQMHAAWWTMPAVDVPVIWAMCAGLAPLHHERAKARGVPSFSATSFYDASSYGPQALAAMRAAGCEVVYGSDRPVVEPGAGYFSSADVFFSS